MDRRSFMRSLGLAAPAAVVLGSVRRQPLRIEAGQDALMEVNGKRDLSSVAAPDGPVVCRFSGLFITGMGPVRRGQHVEVDCPLFTARGRIMSVETSIDTGRLMESRVEGVTRVEFKDWRDGPGGDRRLLVGPVDVKVKVDGEDHPYCRELSFAEEV